MNASEHIEEFVKAFCEPRKRGRYLALLTSAKGRYKLRAELHDLVLDRTRIEKVPPSAHPHLREYLTKRVYDLGATAQCVYWSEDSELEPELMTTEEGIRLAVEEGSGCIVSFTPGKLAYYQSHVGLTRFVCRF